MFMYAEDFSVVQKTRVAIANYLVGAIETIGPSNVLQVVTTMLQIARLPGRKYKTYTNTFYGLLVVCIR